MVMLKLRDYQEEAADFVYAYDKTMVLASVGGGKTAIALTAMQAMIESGIVKRWLVLAPKRVCTDVWPQECEKWSSDLSLEVAVGTPKERARAFHSSAEVVVANYDTIQSITDLSSFDGIVFDELTRLKSPSGKRFKHLEKLIKHINIRVGLTGSFTSNGLEDVYGQVKIVNQELLGKTKSGFLAKYFICINPEFGEFMPRRGALKEVMAVIKPSTFLLDDGDYKDKLPPLHTVELRCDLDDRAPYLKMKQDMVVELKGEKITAMSAAAVTQKLSQGAGGWFYSSTVTASATPGKFITTKTPVWFSRHKFDRLDELLQENQRANTIIVYNFQEELAELKRRYPHAVGMDDQNAAKKWNAGEIEILCLHPKSAGHGLNLQHGGHVVVFLSVPWSLELYEQTIGRLHRSGQPNPVWIYVLLTKGTIDERIWASLHDKKSLSELAIEELK